MSDERKLRPPVACRGLIHVASWIAPSRVRLEWRAHWSFRLHSLWVLVDRGELTVTAATESARLCRSAFADALQLRFPVKDFRRWILGPGSVLWAIAAALMFVALCSHGLWKTRQLIAIARTLGQPLPAHPRYDPRWDAILAYSIPIVLALITGAVLLIIGRMPFRRYGWRYWSFLAAKTSSLILLVSLLWIEGGAALRAHLHNPTLHALVGCALLALLFIVVFGSTMVWSFADQRSRCPVCLRRLRMPVTIGSWSSVLEPAAIEMLCVEGHGALSMSESETGEPHRWTALDPSWRTFFDEAHTSK
jgi:hypothetical protein